MSDFASFSIGIRYWQVISTFGTLNLCWPAPVEGGFSFFNYIAFDLDDYVAQAACAVDRVDQMTKTVAYIVDHQIVQRINLSITDAVREQAGLNK